MLFEQGQQALELLSARCRRLLTMKTQDSLEAMATAKPLTHMATVPPISLFHPLLLPTLWTLNTQVLPAPSRALHLCERQPTRRLNSMAAACGLALGTARVGVAASLRSELRAAATTAPSSTTNPATFLAHQSWRWSACQEGQGWAQCFWLFSHHQQADLPLDERVPTELQAEEQLYHCRRELRGQEPAGPSVQAGAHRVHERTAGGVGEGVPLQPLPVPATPRGDGQPAEPHGASNQDLVPEPAHEVQEGPEGQGHPALAGGPVPGAQPAARGSAGHVAYSGQLPPVPGLAYDAPSPPAFAKSQPNMYGLAAYTAPLSSCLPQQKRYPAPEFEPHPMASNGGGFASANLQGSPVYVGGNFVDSMAPASGPVFNLGHLSHPSSASVDYSCAAQIPGNHHHAPCDPHPTYTDLSAHHSSQGRLPEAPKLTHL
ncbi:hypothetical protein QTO34_002897 [Cnephaeus nilssonii]|uniref:DUF4074 domain-containing protein n=1 Tax=Cnephaeus nilssonii TaxID=3371016 RepID=A0AA40HTA6_CNENI|nr:hypothetical protein QTO34_002897 [Eptesicus nilssonii]